MAQINSINNRSSTLTVDNILTVTAGGAAITGSSAINGGTVGLGTDNANNAITVGAGTTARTIDVGNSAAAHTVTVGSTNGAAATTVQSGSGALNVTATGGALTINSGIGALSISNDASATTVNIASGGAAKIVQLGSTNGASSLALKYGTADFSLASATGNVIVALDTGEVTKPLQPAFLAYLGSTVLNVTGNGGVFQLGSGTALTEIYDINSDFNTNGTFTAPVTGKYTFAAGAIFIGCTNPASGQIQFVASNRTLNAYQYGAGTAVYGLNAVITVDMDAADTMIVNFAVSGEAGDTDDIQGSADNTWFSGNLIC